MNLLFEMEAISTLSVKIIFIINVTPEAII